MLFADLVAAELARSREKYPPLHSHHEGHGLLLDEVAEYWAEVRLQRKDALLCSILPELVQVAAVAQRIAEDLGLIPGTRLPAATPEPEQMPEFCPWCSGHNCFEKNTSGNIYCMRCYQVALRRTL